MKKCFKCLEKKDRSEFYAHKQMGDGLLGKCKECTKKDSTKRRNEKIDEVKAYDRKRYAENREKRRAYDKKRGLTKHRRDSIAKSMKAWKIDNEEKLKANRSLNAAVSNGSLIRPRECSVCGGGGRIEGHHTSYLEKDRLNVQWLCRQCHHDAHRAIRDEAKIKGRANGQ